jgi:hypothetical protein
LSGGQAGIIAGTSSILTKNILFLWDHIVPKLFGADYQTNVGTGGIRLIHGRW